MRTVLHRPQRDLLAWYFSRGADNPEAVSAEDFEVYARTLQLPNALRAGMEYCGAVWDDAEDKKAAANTKLRMPVLALGGKAAIAQGVEAWASQVAENVKGVVLDGAGHWLTDERPKGLDAARLQFFAHEL